ncbi:MAG: enoyl-CoA hydratase [Gammaproteobacteria bacterium]|nr:enoyl-CoA hydratase [Gammaproteobacteria bacterium]RPG25301.1 MAG: enoyl-CoA hydratase [Gammaproteobacteria bacterium TMED50]|tara:strand:+ start:12185 stop:12967 length:783 start_codon:yes stop_codon:yes gene_type:complete
MTTSDLVLRTTKNRVTTVTLNRPEALNALSTGMKNAIITAFQALKEDAETDVIILTGAGRAFTAGLDLKELGQSGFSERTIGDLQEVVTGVGKPIIGAINGFAITGGFELALMCDIMIGTPDTRFADTHVRMGVVPGWGLSQRLATLIGRSRAMEMSLTGNYIDAETAESWGLINRILPQLELVPHCQGLAESMLAGDHTTMQEVHRLIRFGQDHTLAEGITEERRATQAHKGDKRPETLEDRRLKVMDRGREQVGGSDH